MVVRKPFEQAIPRHIEELIDKGAKTKGNNESEKKKWTLINLRLPTNMLNDVDKILEERAGISRNGWVLEAIQEKLKRAHNENG